MKKCAAPHFSFFGFSQVFHSLGAPMPFGVRQNFRITGKHGKLLWPHGSFDEEENDAKCHFFRMVDSLLLDNHRQERRVKGDLNDHSAPAAN